MSLRWFMTVGVLAIVTFRAQSGYIQGACEMDSARSPAVHSWIGVSDSEAGRCRDLGPLLKGGMVAIGRVCAANETADKCYEAQ